MFSLVKKSPCIINKTFVLSCNVTISKGERPHFKAYAVFQPGPDIEAHHGPP
jgi:hypothetical protein